MGMSYISPKARRVIKNMYADIRAMNKERRKKGKQGDLTIKEIVDLFADEYLGSGVSRKVFSLKGTDEVVLKVIYDYSGSYKCFANALEFQNWAELEYWEDASKWLAPCISINENGTILIQKRAVVAKNRKELPKEVPAFFTDKKVSNWGFIDGNPVCLDYAYLNFHQFVPKKMPMKPARWWYAKKK